MAPNTQEKFISSYSAITLSLVKDRYLKQPHTKDKPLENILGRCAIKGIEDGEQIGRGNILHNVIDSEISTLQKIDQELIKLDNTLQTSLATQAQEFETQRNGLITAHEDLEAAQSKQTNKILGQLENALDKEPFWKSSSNAAMKVVEKQSSDLSDQALKLLTAVQHAQQKRIDQYKKLYNSVDETQRKTLELLAPEEFEAQKTINALKRHSITSSMGAQSDKSPKATPPEAPTTPSPR